MGSRRRVVISVLLAETILIRCSSLSLPTQRPLNNIVRCSPLRMVAISPPDLSVNTNVGSDDDEIRSGAMMDTTGIALSGLKGKALSLTDADYPKAKELKAVIPKDCFIPETSKSLGYLSVSFLGTALCTAVGIKLLGLVGTSIWSLPIWTAYSAVTGTVAMGLWVLAHECGHGAFSKNRRLQDSIGFIVHSIIYTQIIWNWGKHTSQSHMKAMSTGRMRYESFWLENWD